MLRDARRIGEYYPGLSPNSPECVLILDAAIRNAMDGGAQRFRFCCDEHNRDMVNLARRCGAEVIRVEAEYRLRPG